MLKSAMLSAVALLLTVGATSAQNTIIAIDGSSTVFPITEAMAEEFQKANKGIKVTVGIGGTGGGFKKFCRGEIDISDASRPIRDVEREECKKNKVEFIELPIALDALSVMVNPKNDWAKEMTVAELKKIWEPEAQGKVTNWKQVRASFPDRPLKLYGAGVNSGTYDYFTAAIVGKEHSSRGDFTASEDDNVLVQGIAGDINALGFFGLAYYLENQSKLKAVAIKMKEQLEGGAAVGRRRTGRQLSAAVTPDLHLCQQEVRRDQAGRGEVRRILPRQVACIEARQGGRLCTAAGERL